MTASRRPSTSQSGLHERLDEVVRRHLSAPWQQPVRSHTRKAFERLAAGIDAHRPLIVDAGCGNGQSTCQLAAGNPGSLVIGVDKSHYRLARAPELPANARLIRAELADFWRLAVQAGWQLQRHCIFYPNPWPKPGQLKRRWHAHPVFPQLVVLGGELELRTNFELYAREFRRALSLAGVADAEVVSLQVTEPVSPFERKYFDSGHPLWKLTANLSRS